MGVHIGTTWQIRLRHPCTAAMQPFFVKLLWPLVLNYHYLFTVFVKCQHATYLTSLSVNKYP